MVLSLLKHLPKNRPTSVVLVDPPIEMDAEKLVERKVKFSDDVRANRGVDDYAALNPLWTREDAIWKVLGTQIGRTTNAPDHIDVSFPATSISESTVLMLCHRAMCRGHFRI